MPMLTSSQKHYQYRRMEVFGDKDGLAEEHMRDHEAGTLGDVHTLHVQLQYRFSAVAQGNSVVLGLYRVL